MINVIAVAYGLLMATNLIWPRELIYGEGKAWGGVLFIAVVVGLGLLYYFVAQHGRETKIATHHRAATTTASPTVEQAPSTLPIKPEPPLEEA